MTKLNLYRAGTALSLIAALGLASSGCSNLPGTPGQQGAAIGGVSGAAAGAAIGGSQHRLLGVLLGGALGAGGGYLIGANKDKITGHDTASAQAAVQKAQANPATPQQALSAKTADLNGDGFVTMDEIVAMKKAGLSDQQMLERLQATGQVFELTPEQQNYLRTNGVDDVVINQLPDINRQVRNQILNQPTTGESTNSVLTQPVPPPPGR